MGHGPTKQIVLIRECIVHLYIHVALASLAIEHSERAYWHPAFNCITNCRQYCLGLLGLISAVLMSRMEVMLVKPPQVSHTCGTSKPCQSAQTSEPSSMRNC